MSGNKQWVTRFVVLSLLLVLLVGIAIFVVDPLQHYRRATFYRPLWGTKRYYNPGYVRHYDYDCIVIGSSMVNNFAPSEVGRVLSMKVLVASMPGGKPYEERVLLSTALRTGKVRTVIWALDLQPLGGIATRPGSMPFYLYDDNPLNDYQYLLNGDILLRDCGKVLLYSLFRNRRGGGPGLGGAHPGGGSSPYSREATVRTWQRRRAEYRGRVRTRAEDVRRDVDSMQKSFDSNILSMAESNPDIRFYFFYPPYSILYWIDTGIYGLDTYLEAKRYIFSRFRNLPNVRLFDFQDVDSITLDLDNYLDYSHSSPDVSSYIIDAIAHNQYLVTDDNVDERISRLEDQVRRFTDSLAVAERDGCAGVPQSPDQSRPRSPDGEDFEP